MKFHVQLFVLIFLLTGLPVNGQTPFLVYYTPVILPNSAEPEYYRAFEPKLLAEDLARLLSQSTGRKFEATVFDHKRTPIGIFLILDSSLKNLGNETGVVESDGRSFLRIRSGYATGISYAMYSWLQEMGFHFYLPGDEWTIIPRLKKIFPKKFRKAYAPHFKLRMFNASGGIFPVKGLDEDNRNKKDWQQWYIRNRMGCDYISIDGHIGELFNIVHKKEIENDTMLLAPVNGKRQYSEEGKLDPTNKKAVDLFSSWLVKEFQEKQQRMPQYLPFKKYQSADAGDGLNYCHTPECETLFKSVSDQVFYITNEAARKVKQVDLRAGVSTLAYTERADTPSIKIEPNVHVMVVPTGFQAVSTATELMQRWSKKTKNISQYDFLNIGVWYYDAPFFDLNAYHKNLLFLQKLKVQGMNIETSLSKFASGLQQYFILKFLCEPYPSIEKHFDQFCIDNFGKAAEPVKKLFQEWYFSGTHLNTGLDKASFYPDELGRFVQYIVDADALASSAEVKKRITELKAYLIYLCDFYEIFTDLAHQKKYAADPALQQQKANEILTYTWQLYDTKIFHNTQLNDMLKKHVTADDRSKWDYRKSDHYRSIKQLRETGITKRFDAVKFKYLPQQAQTVSINEGLLDKISKFSADSIIIRTIDEKAFGHFVYPLPFYAGSGGKLTINFIAGSSQNSKTNAHAAIVSVESNDYSFIKTIFIQEESSGKIIVNIPKRGYYKLYLSQFNATNVQYKIYPHGNLFYLNRKSILSNGMLLQDTAQRNYYPNKFLAVLSQSIDTFIFSNRYWNSTNTLKLYTPSGRNIAINNSRQPAVNTAVISKEGEPGLIYFENEVFRWPIIPHNIPPYYFFLRFPQKK